MNLEVNKKYKITIPIKQNWHTDKSYRDKLGKHPFVYEREVTYLGKDHASKDKIIHIFYSDMNMFDIVNYENSTWTSKDNLQVYQYLLTNINLRMIKVNTWHLHVSEDDFIISVI